MSKKAYATICLGVLLASASFANIQAQDRIEWARQVEYFLISLHLNLIQIMTSLECERMKYKIQSSGEKLKISRGFSNLSGIKDIPKLRFGYRISASLYLTGF